VGITRRYPIALLCALILAAGYVGITQLQAAHARSQGRSQVAYDAQLAAAKVQAAALLSRVKVPNSLPRATSSQPCQTSDLELCLTSQLPPAEAIRPALRAVRALGFSVGPVKCPPPLNAQGGEPFKPLKAFEPDWAPCNVSVGTAANGLTIEAFPLRNQRLTLRRRRLSFKGSSVSIAANWFPPF
jgi:hypothetical protein